MDINNIILQKIYQHANKTYPEECCGFVLKDGTVHEACNILNELHNMNPIIYPRTAKNGYISFTS